ncbi:GNAT family N-acetyltransferase [Nocardioides sediminis]|uniref:GNAT family N-acetyltransferase n=1 Tax=Nocardioides sediminis TaxID=433648 RepID=UPI0018FFD05B|nr:GNAT family protein [Nocardioides sediminis]
MHASPWPVHRDGLLFRDAVEKDIPALQDFRNDPVANHFMVHNQVDPDDLRRDWLAVASSPTDYSCVVDRDGEVVAMGFLEVVDGPGQPGSPPGTDGLIGYFVDPRFAGQGIGTTTARALLGAAFEDLGLRRVTAAAYADNNASVRVLERAGMRRERHSVQALWHRDLGWVDEVEYALLREEWVDMATAAHVAGTPFAEFRAAADAVARQRPEVDLDTAREVFDEAARRLHDGLALEGLDDHDLAAVVAGLCVDLVAEDPGAAVRARAEAARRDAGDLHDPDAVAAAFLVSASVLQL